MTPQNPQSGCGTVQEKLPLFDTADRRYKDCKDGFEFYDLKHPETWRLFKDCAFAAIHAGETRLGAKAIFEAIRRHCRSDEEFALNNTYAKDYARKFCNMWPEHKHLFEFRGNRT